jgi:hypothetical protein
MRWTAEELRVKVTFETTEEMVHEIVARLYAHGRRPSKTAVRAALQDAYSAEGYLVHVDVENMHPLDWEPPTEMDYRRATLFLEGFEV